MADDRLPAHLEVAGLLRAVEAAGGFATVLRKGERTGGAILVILAENGANQRLFERLAHVDGTREWTCTKVQDTENKAEFSEYLARRGARDPDLWMIELDIANGERFVVSS